MGKGKGSEPRKLSTILFPAGAGALGVLLLLAVTGAGESSSNSLADLKCAFADRDYDRAERGVRELLNRGADPALSTLLGRILLERGRAAEAREQFQAVVQNDPSNIEAGRGLAQSLRALGQAGLGVAQLQKLVALEAGKSDPRLWKELGVFQRDAGDSHGALASLQRSLTLDSRQSDVSELISEIATSREATAEVPGLPASMGPTLRAPNASPGLPGRRDARGLLPFQNPSPVR